MESNPDPAALAEQVQALAATIEELTKQNQEMKLRLSKSNRMRTAPRETRREKGIATGEVPLKGQLLQMNRTQTSFER